jgi:Domain of unknown function (DUF4157)
MFQAPINGSKENSQANRTVALPEPQRELYPHLGDFRGSRVGLSMSTGATPDSARFRQLQSAIGNRAIIRSLPQSRAAIQTKLTVNRPGDRYEEEADHIADHVMRMPSPEVAPVVSTAAVSSIQRSCSCGGSCSSCGDESSQTLLQAKPIHDESLPRIIPAHQIEGRIAARESYGAMLPSRSLRFMESRFQHDFGNVRIHTDTEADRLNYDLHAYAFASGRNIFFANGQFRPGTESGDRLLAHELTHILQQSSGSAGVRPKLVQRAPRFGKWAHDKIETKLIEANPDLLAEVEIPAGKAPTDVSLGFDWDKFNVLGRADLYRAPKHQVPGILAQIADGDDPKGIGEVSEPRLKYSNIGPRQVKGPADFSPRVESINSAKFRKSAASKNLPAGGTNPYIWTKTPGFPESFEIGEIKALFPSHRDSDFDIGDFGPAMLQTNNYISGLENFVPRVFQDSDHQTRMDTKGAPMPIGPGEGMVHIPPEIDYLRLGNEGTNASTDQMIFKGKTFAGSRWRLWVHSRDAGLLHYFFLPHPLTDPAYRSNIQNQFDKLDKELLPQVKQKHPTSIPLKKGKPGLPPRTIVVQRQALPGVQDEDAISAPGEFQGTWRQQWEVFEKQRKEWAGTQNSPGTAKEFLEHSAQGALEKLEVDKKLNLPTAETDIPREAPMLREISRWGGPFGKLIGLLRFRFGWLIDKVQALFTKVKAKFDGFKESAHVEAAGSGWIRKALGVVGDFLLGFIKNMAGQAYAIAADCVNGTLESVIDQFADEVMEALRAKLESIFEAVQKLHEKIDETFGPLIDGVQAVLSAFATYRKWVDIISDVKWALRILIEAISCGIPPGLGCLWGVLEQVGFDLAATMAIGTNLFKRKIGDPAARTLVDAVAGNTIRTFASDIMSDIGLGSVADTVNACHHYPRISGKRFDRDIQIDPDDPEIQKVRGELENVYGVQMIHDLEAAFGSGGEPATRAQVEDLIAQLQESGLTIEEFRRKLRRDNKGKYSMTQALAITARSGGSGGGGGSGDGGSGSGKDHPVPSIDLSHSRIGQSAGDSPTYTFSVVTDESHHKSKAPITISVNLLKNGERIAVLTNISVVVIDRENYSEGGAKITYQTVGGNTFKLGHAHFVLPDQFFGTLQ